MRDEALIDALKRDDTSALEAAIRQYGSYVAAVIYRQLGASPRQEDVEELSATFLRRCGRAGGG